MCRINGIWGYNKPINVREIGDMSRDMQAHGGPDAFGSYISQEDNLYMGHRRLSIINVDESGNQPMIEDHLTMVFNGEIYNYQELKSNLPADYKTHSDTEVILKYWKKYGVHATSLFRGMFSFVIWDDIEKKMFLIRDRLGVKPLYYYHKDGLLMFGSELKSLLVTNFVDKTIDQESLSLFLQQGYIPSPNSILKHVKKVLPGYCYTINTNGDLSKHQYWSAKDEYRNSKPIEKPANEWKPILLNELKESFKLRMVADVPVGMFLSGGIDSSLVTAILSQEVDSTLNTFTIGFEDKNYNEAGFAKDISDYLNTNHHEIILNEKDFEDVIPLLPDLCDEPMGDSSIIPTYCVSRMASKYVKVSLSADGGDELFGGYTKYEITKRLAKKSLSIPKPIRSILFQSLGLLNPYNSEFLTKLPFINQYKNLGSKIIKFRNALKAENVTDFFNQSSVFITERAVEQLIGTSTARIEEDLAALEDESRLITYLGLLDVHTYLEGDILTKVDRTTMANALEGREPLLDHKLYELSLSIPDDRKISPKPKQILRDILYDYVPKHLIERPKQGFAIPIEKWLKGDLKSVIVSIPEDKPFIEYCNFNLNELKQHIDSFYRKDANPTLIWYFYVLYVWYKKWID